MSVTLQLDEEKFIEKEIKVWGIDYISDLFDKDFKPEFIDGKWRWVQPAINTQAVAVRS